jgi:hypothetical protein
MRAGAALFTENRLQLSLLRRGRWSPTNTLRRMVQLVAAGSIRWELYSTRKIAVIALRDFPVGKRKLLESPLPKPPPARKRAVEREHHHRRRGREHSREPWPIAEAAIGALYRSSRYRPADSTTGSGEPRKRASSFDLRGKRRAPATRALRTADTYSGLCQSEFLRYCGHRIVVFD